MQFNIEQKWSNSDWKNLLANNIIFEIHIWHFIVSQNQFQQNWIKISKCLQNIIHPKCHLIIVTILHTLYE
jgi:hypothetical protein